MLHVTFDRSVRLRTLYTQFFLEFVFVPFKLNKNGCICHSCEINVGKSCCTCLNFEARADTERRAYLHWNTPKF